MDNKLIEKIQKLLALANDGRGNESEMNSAMEKVHVLLSEHNLSMADVENHTVDDKLSVDVERNVFYDDSSGHLKHWKGLIWDAIARLYYGYLYSRLVHIQDPTTGRVRKVTRYTIIAHKDNAQIATTMINFVISQANQIANEECRGKGRSYKDSFLKGLAMRVGYRVDELIRKAKRGELQGEGTALVRLDDLYNAYDKAQQDLIKQLGVTLRTSSTAYARSADGYRNGNVAGDRISLNMPIGQSTTGALR